MKKFVVLLSLFVGVFLGFMVVSHSYLASLDESTFGDLIDQYPGYLPISISQSSVSAVYTVLVSGSTQYAIDPLTGSGPYVNTHVSYPYSGFGLAAGFAYYVPSFVPAFSTLSFTISVPVTSSVSRFSYYSVLPASISSFSVSSSLSSFKFTQAVHSISNLAVALLDSSGVVLSSPGILAYGGTLSFEFYTQRDLDGFYLLFSSGYGTPQQPTECYFSHYIGDVDVHVNVSSPDYLAYLRPIYLQLVDTGNYVQHISVNSDKIVQYLQDLSIASGTPSEMQRFEDAYLEKMGDQLSQVENMLSPQNTALPNGGDFAGFVQDVQDGLGVNGSSFNASDFSSATSKFGSSGAVGPGGPWEFFSQSVADSLAGDISSFGLSDDDYIYAWLDEMQRRYAMWGSFSP